MHGMHPVKLPVCSLSTSRVTGKRPDGFLQLSRASGTVTLSLHLLMPTWRWGRGIAATFPRQRLGR